MRRIQIKEEYAIILDFLPFGDAKRGRNFPVAQAIGRDYFILLELTPKPGIELKPEEEVYIGSGQRDKINSILGKLRYDDLTPSARELLPKVIEKLVERHEKRFINWINKAQAITPRLHMLELLPGIGKKHLWEILEKREEKPFESFEDFKKRCGIDIKKAIVKRILIELQGLDKYRLFVGVPF